MMEIGIILALYRPVAAVVIIWLLWKLVKRSAMIENRLERIERQLDQQSEPCAPKTGD
jgi:hypothetical protein